MHEWQTDVSLGRPFIVSLVRDEVVVGVPLDPVPAREWRVIFFRGPGDTWPARFGRFPPSIVGPEAEIRTRRDTLEEALSWLRRVVGETNRIVEEEEIPRETEFRRLHDEAVAQQERDRLVAAEDQARRIEEIEDRLQEWSDGER